MHVVCELEVLQPLDAQILVDGAVQRNRTLVEKYFSHVNYLCPAVPGSPPTAPPPKPGVGSTDEQPLYQRAKAGASWHFAPVFRQKTSTDCMRFAMNLFYAAEKPSAIA
ncbi:hypothetical protein GCM10010981_23870 [Dyella nitratireducens]|uniref:Uncharacterized protein n=1 Tax=Dyella nitratireducens TaxID=1849580 RepID=A0ABQ1G0D0_9GAMM|nr:hypothetical protein GCM10010981_23870 [Dyella nitratireducens]GLQ40821.1 hypothetical protein GCM10007902_06710 [Dyella nitratireducens]